MVVELVTEKPACDNNMLKGILRKIETVIWDELIEKMISKDHVVIRHLNSATPPGRRNPLTSRKLFNGSGKCSVKLKDATISNPLMKLLGIVVSVIKPVITSCPLARALRQNFGSFHTSGLETELTK